MDSLEHGSDGFFVFFAEAVVPKTVSAGRRVRRGAYNIGRGSENGGVYSGRYGAAAHPSEVMALPLSSSHSLVMPSVV